MGELGLVPMRALWWWSSRIAAGAFLLALGSVIVSVPTLWTFIARLGVALVVWAIGLAVLIRTAVDRYRPAESGDPDARIKQDSVQAFRAKFRHDAELASSVTALKSHTGKRYRIAGRVVSVETVARLAFMLEDRRRFHGRIVEEITPQKRSLRRRVSSSLILSFPGSAALDADEEEVGGDHGQIFYPLTMVPKGFLTDNFHVSIKGEDATVTLTYEEYCQLMVVLVRTYVKFCASVAPELLKKLDKLSWQSLRIICRRQVQSDRYDLAEQRAGKVRKRLHDLAAEIQQQDVEYALEMSDYVRQIGDFAEKFCSRYPLLLVIPLGAVKDNRVVVRYEQDYPPAWCFRHEKNQRRSFYLERIGSLLGGQAGRIDVDLERAQDAQSFHLIFHGGEETYLADQQMIGSANFKMRGHKSKSPPGRFTRPMGQSYFHGYFRDLARRKKRPGVLKARLTFYEVPPGAIGKATIAAFSSFVITSTIGILMPAMRATTQNPLPSALTSFSGLILAVPAASAAWVGLDKSGAQSILGTEVTARFSAYATFALSLSGFALFLATAQHGPAWSTPGFSVMGFDDWAWFLLATAIFITTVCSAVSWAGRSIRYLAIGKRAQEEFPTDIQLKEVLVPDIDMADPNSSFR